MIPDDNAKRVLASAKIEFFKNPDVTSVSLGYRYKKGKRKEQLCIVVGVARKLSAEVVRSDKLLPAKFDGIAIDVQEKPIKAQDVPTLSLVQKRRPCPPGYSIGHVSISAGTLGFYAKRGASDDWLVFSNNHVLADSNGGKPNDKVIQPGKADGGFSGEDLFAWLRDYVTINFDGNGDKKKAASWAWRAWKWPANAIARLAKCEYRLQVGVPGSIDQPSPNLVDLAWAKPTTQGNVDLDMPFDLGQVTGIRDLQLGDRVRKVGRTTELTTGAVVGVDSKVRVSYGTDGVALYDDQLEIKADSGDFSAGGDSGSAILTMDNYLGGLLFAGGGGVTIANPIRHVVALSGMRL
jgi:hypothetical protein